MEFDLLDPRADLPPPMVADVTAEGRALRAAWRAAKRQTGDGTGGNASHFHRLAICTIDGQPVVPSVGGDGVLRRLAAESQAAWADPVPLHPERSTPSTRRPPPRDHGT